MGKYKIPKYQKALIAEGANSTILDTLSVLSGFRRVGLTGLHEKLAGKPLGNAVKDLETLVKQHKNFGIRTLCDNGEGYGLYFVFRKDAEDDVIAFCKKYNHQLPNYTQEGSEDIGKLLGYPNCCTKEHTTKAYDFPLIPLAACSEKCGRKWFEHYLQLAKESGINEIKVPYSGKVDLTKYGFARTGTTKVEVLNRETGEICKEERPEFTIKLT